MWEAPTHAGFHLQLVSFHVKLPRGSPPPAISPRSASAFPEQRLVRHGLRAKLGVQRKRFGATRVIRSGNAGRQCCAVGTA